MDLNDFKFSVDQVLQWVVPDIDDCREAAAQMRLREPELTPEAIAYKAVQGARKWAMAAGAASGIASSPLTFLPAAVVDAAAMLRIEGRLAGVVAALLDPSSLDDPDAFRRDVLAVVFPGVVSQVLRRIGVRVGEQAAKRLVERAVTRGVLKEVVEHVTKLLGVTVARKALVTKTVPLVGAGIGAAWNWAELQAIGRYAIQYHTGGPPAQRLREKLRVMVSRRGRRTLPGPDEP